MRNATYEAERAGRLQAILGEPYVVRYDDCESGKTRIWFDGHLIHEVPNSAMSGDIMVSDYYAPPRMKSMYWAWKRTGRSYRYDWEVYRGE